MVSRLVYRKGVDLLAGVISKMSNMKNIRFLIGGDGPKRTLLEEVREKHNIQDRVTLLGALEHSRVKHMVHIKFLIHFVTKIKSQLGSFAIGP